MSESNNIINTTADLYNNSIRPVVRPRQGFRLPASVHLRVRREPASPNNFNEKLKKRILTAHKRGLIPITKNQKLKNETVIISTKNAISNAYNTIKNSLQEKGHVSTTSALKNMNYGNLSDILNQLGVSVSNNNRNYIKLYKNLPITIKKNNEERINLNKINVKALAKKHGVVISPERPKKKSKTNENNNRIKFYEIPPFETSQPNKIKKKAMIMSEVLNDKNMEIKHVYDYNYLLGILREPGIKNVSPIRHVPFTKKSIKPYNSKYKNKYNTFLGRLKLLKLGYKEYYEKSIKVSVSLGEDISHVSKMLNYICGYDELKQLIGNLKLPKKFNPYKPVHEISEENAYKLMLLVNLFRRLKINNINKNSPILDMIHVASKNILFKIHDNKNYKKGIKKFFNKINKNDIKKYKLNKIFNYKI
jgi:hypothetical protein